MANRPKLAREIAARTEPRFIEISIIGALVPLLVRARLSYEAFTID